MRWHLKWADDIERRLARIERLVPLWKRHAEIELELAERELKELRAANKLKQKRKPIRRTK